MPENEDVEQTESSTVNVESTEAGAVTPADDRPAKNYQAEFNRKFTRVERQQQEVTQRLDAIAQMLLQQNQSQQVQQAPVQAGPDTEEQLWSRAQQGDRLAFDEYMARKARREVQQERSVNNRGQMVSNQMQALMNKYPVLNDGNHALTQTAQQAYQLLLRSGYPAGQETLLEAAKTAIADRPDLVSDLYTQGAQAREGARRNATQSANSGQMGSSLRQDAPRAQNAVTIRPGEMAIASRMLTPSKLHPEEKTPEQRAKGAKERFLERQKSKQSSLGAVSGFVNGDDF